MNFKRLSTILMPLILVACQVVKIEDLTSPSVTNVSPSVLSATGGEQVIIRGRELRNIKEILIGQTVCSGLQKISDSELRCTSPSNSGLPEIKDITLISRDNKRLTLDDAVSYTLLLGQPDANTFGYRDRVFSNPYMTKVVAGKLFVMDNGNNRLMVWNTIPSSPFTPPDLILGQPNGKELLLYVSNSRFKSQAFWTDGTKLAITDLNAHRVLLWNSFPTRNNQPADVVLGQPDFITGTSNTGPSTPECGGTAGRNACSLKSPKDIGFFENKLYVADTDNHRILIWNGWPTENQKPADSVLGQSNFLTGSANNGPNTPACGATGLNACSLNSPYYFTYHGSKFIVSDYNNNRILIFNTLPVTSGTPADLVLGQPDFTTNTQNNGPATAPCGGVAGVNHCSLRNPLGIATDGNSLYVADRGNNRVLGWTVFPSANHEPANLVLGQLDFFSVSSNKGNSLADASSLSMPTSLFLHANQLWVSDMDNHRSLRFGPLPLTDAASANLVIGHETFFNRELNSFTASGDRLQQIPDASYDGTHFIIADRINGRVIITEGLPQTLGSASKIILGQPDETSLHTNSGPNTVACGGVAGLNACSFYGPMAVLKVNNKLVVTDFSNRRVLIWNSMPTTTLQPADLVLGQPDFFSNTVNSGPNTPACGGTLGRNKCSLNGPIGLASDGTNLIVSDITDNRILIWNTFPTSNQQPADLVLGQPNFTSGTSNNGPNTAACDSTAGVNRCSLNQPFFMELVDGKLIVADRENHRVLIWNTMPTVNQQPADVVIGQPDFVTRSITNPPTASSLYTAGGVCVTGSGKLVISDMNNHRIVVYNSIPTANSAVPDKIIGQSAPNRNFGDAGASTALGTFNTPYGVGCYGEQVIVSDYNNSRVQMFHLPE